MVLNPVFQDDGLVSLSAPNSSFWNQLVNLDRIKEQSKPAQPVKPESIPFFLDKQSLNAVSGAKEFEKTAKKMPCSPDVWYTELEALLMSQSDNCNGLHG
ncbi:hypothetical protein DI09_6p180 [Mitosporidium daphniae]|uniref:WDR36/Utp21 C-terminal domain-containing protein n=1 Tax=Mitosporidium daphniae TaxID=1485682 RepID=A0A098VNT2_9MICR|nr:uncharacterized protein DI09_6p180 [Mitosporidium daphniae]KGG50434.1 hypothetical protein DI09_6p180 [Mitosporidium daphniae]|eukprot:XP_013236861.1 uncharacterized protein DI09_6p180 [Mitosporidium daphniae]